MIPGTIGRMIRRANLSLLLVHFACLVGVLTFAGTLGRPLMDALWGGWTVTPHEMVSALATREIGHLYVCFDVPNAAEPEAAGIWWDEQTVDYADRNRVAWHWYFLHVGNSIMVFQTTAQTAPTHVAGIACHYSGRERDAIYRMARQNIQGSFSPLMIEEPSMLRFLGWLVVPLACVTVLAGNTWYMGVALCRLANDRRHPAARIMANHGSVDDVASAIDAETHGPNDWAGGEFRLLEHWVMREGLVTFRMMFIPDVIWACERETITHSRYGGETHHFWLHLADRRGQHLMCELDGHDSVQKVVTWIIDRAPWVVTEDHPALARRFRKDLPGFVAMVDQVKTQLEKSGHTR